MNCSGTSTEDAEATVCIHSAFVVVMTALLSLPRRMHRAAL